MMNREIWVHLECLKIDRVVQEREEPKLRTFESKPVVDPCAAALRRLTRRLLERWSLR